MKPRFQVSSLVIATFYVSSIFVMAGVYFVYWLARPDYFRVQSGVNSLPIDLYNIARKYNAEQHTGNLLQPLIPLDPGEAEASGVRALYADIETTSDLLARQQAAYINITRDGEAKRNAFDDSMFRQVDQYVANKTSTYRAQIASLDIKMNGILQNAGVDTSQDLPTGPVAVAYAELDEKRAAVDAQRAQVEADARRYAVAHLTDFQRHPMQQPYLREYRRSQAAESQIEALKESIYNKQAGLYGAFVKYFDAAHQRLGYWDFVYFSVGAATTATFGDISPNSTRIRLLTCAQVIFSITLAGITINKLAK